MTDKNLTSEEQARKAKAKKAAAVAIAAAIAAGGLAIMLPIFITVLRVVGKYRKAAGFAE